MSAPLRLLRAALAAAAVLLVACARGPQPIAIGSDACETCRMTISDARFGAELVTTKGKVRKFDSVECLAAYYLTAEAQGAVRSVWVTDFRHPGTFVPAEEAKFVRAKGSAEISSPMGAGLFAFAPDADVAAEARQLGGTAMTWSDVVALARAGDGVSERHDAAMSANRDEASDVGR